MRPPRVPTLRAVIATAVLGGAGALSSCSVHEHTVGLGPNGIGTQSVRQYYLFFGWLRLNEVDTQRLAQDATSYRVRTEWSFVDFVLSPFLLPLTVTTRTVTVER